MITFTYTAPKKWTLLEKEIVLPLAKIATWWANAVRTRVRMQGRGARGAYTRYGGTGDGRVWVQPGKPQPQAAKYRVTEGPWSGWAIYPDYDTLLRLSGKKGKAKRFEASGWLWDRLSVKAMSPAHVQIRFSGSTRSRGKKARGLRLERLARELMAPERQGLLTPTPEEWATMEKMLRDDVEQQIFGAAAVADTAYSARRQLASAQSRAARLTKRLSAL